MQRQRIETERLLLTSAVDSDIDRLVALDADPAAMRFINGGLPSSRSDVARRVHAANGWMFMAVERSTNEFVGWFSIRPSSSSERELGYRLGRAHWGQGLATAGARAMMRLAFADARVDRVWAQTMTVNTASRRVMERCGLTFVRTFFDEWPGGPIEGSEHGDVEYEIRRSTHRTLPGVARTGEFSARPASVATRDDARASLPGHPVPAMDRPPR